MEHVKKITKKDRYGNQVSMEFEASEKPFDYNKMFESMLSQQVPDMQEAPPVMGEEFNMGNPATHPGGPMGEDTVPAWLTPGEFVVNAEATEMFGPQIEAMNEVGRMVQGGQVPEYARAGKYIKDTAKEIGVEGAASTMIGDASAFMMNPWIAAAMYALTPKQMGDATPTQADYVNQMAYEDANMVPEGYHRMPDGSLMADTAMYNDGGAVPIPYDQALLEAREGFRDDVYLDSLGKPTVGHGHLLGDEYMDRVGETPFNKEELDGMFQDDIAIARRAARRNAEANGVDWNSLNRMQQGALVSQAYQLGETGQGKFKKMWGAMAEGDNEGVRREAMDSTWATQTPTRAEDLVSAFNMGGSVPSPMIAAPLLYPPQYRDIGGYVDSMGRLPSGQSYNHYKRYGASPATTIWMDTLNKGRPDKTGELAEVPITGLDVPAPRETVHPMGDAVPMAVGNTEVPDIGSSVPPNVAGEVTDMGERVSGAQALPVSHIERNIDKSAVAGSALDQLDGQPYHYGNETSSVLDNMGGQPYHYGNESTSALDQFTAQGLSVPPEAPTQHPMGAEVPMATPSAEQQNEYSGASQYRPAGFGEKQTGRDAVETANMNTKRNNVAAAEAELARLEEKLANGEKVKPGNVEQARKNLEHHRNKLREAEAEYNKQGEGSTAVGGEEIVSSAGDQQTQSGGTINDIIEGTNEDAAADGSDNQDEGAAEDAGNNATDEQKGQAEGMMKSIFGDLFDSAELKRMGIMYLGSRLMGHSHGGSLNWALKNYVNRTDQKVALRGQQAQQLAASGDYDLASVQRFKETGDYNQLKAKGKPVTLPERTDQQVFVKGAGVRSVFKDSNDNQWVKNAQGTLVPLHSTDNAPFDKSTMGSNAVTERFDKNISSAVGALNAGVGEEDEGYVNVDSRRLATRADSIFQKELRNAKFPIGSTSALQEQLDTAMQMYLDDVKKAKTEGGEMPQPEALEYYYNALKVNQTAGVSPALIMGTSMEQQVKTSQKLLGMTGGNEQAMRRVYNAAAAAWNLFPEKDKKRYTDIGKKSGQSGFTLFINKVMNDDKEVTPYVQQITNA